MLEIKEVRGLGGEVHEDVLVGRGTPYVCRQEREWGVGRQDWRWRGGGHGHEAVKGVRPAVRTGLSALDRRGGRSAAVKVGEAAGMGEGVEWEWEWSICVWAVGGGTARGGAVEWRGDGHLHGWRVLLLRALRWFSMPSEHKRG